MSNLKYLLILVLSSCEPYTSKTIEGTNLLLDEVCIRGVTYYIGGRMLSPEYNNDGSLILCENKLDKKENK